MRTRQPTLFDGIEGESSGVPAAPLPVPPPAGARRPAPPQLSLFAAEDSAGAAPLPEGYRVVDTPEALETLIAALSAAACFALDTETTALDPIAAGLVGLSFSARAGEAFYVPVGHQAGRQLAQAQVAEALQPVLEDPSRAKVGHNLKFDLRVLERAGLRVAGPLIDTMIAAYLIEEDAGHGLKEWARRRLGREMMEYEALTSRGHVPLETLPVATVAGYACDDAEATLALSRALLPELEQSGLARVFEWECRLVPVVARMESDGVAIDAGYLAGLARDLEARMQEKALACFEAAGCRFNLNSTKQVAEILYGRLALPANYRTATGLSTAEAALRELAPLHPLPERLLEYRELNKLLTTYALALPRSVSPVTGRIHPNFQQIGARSGRFSCANPNLQNLPKDAANTIRRAFVAEPGCVLLSADYSQIELRILAYVSRDPALLAAFGNDEDVHARTAADIFAVGLDAVTPEQRRVAKSINFGLVYGMSAQGLAAQLGIPVAEADAYVQAYFARYAGVKRYMADTLRQARAQGYVTTLLGRRRHVGDLHARDGRTRGQAERQMINAPVQGSAADIIKAAMVRLAPRLPPLGARMILQVHDELVIEVPEGNLAALREAVVCVMEEPPIPEFDVPLRVDEHVDRAWH